MKDFFNEEWKEVSIRNRKYTIYFYDRYTVTFCECKYVFDRFYGFPWTPITSELLEKIFSRFSETRRDIEDDIGPWLYD